MVMSPLHRLAEMIRDGEYIDDDVLLDTLGRDGTIVVPLRGGGDRRLPSGEILSVLADASGVTVDQVLARNFRLRPDEISAADTFMRLVQFAGDQPAEPPQNRDLDQPPEQPFQPIDH